MALQQTKSMYQTLRTYFAMVENDFGKIPDFGPYPYASIFGGEVCKFAYYLAAADGRLDERERLYINEITGYAESTQAMVDMMKQSGVVLNEDRERFAQTPFTCLVIALIADAAYKEIGQDSDLFKMVLTFFVLLGSDLISIDGQIAPTEQAALQAIVDTMQSVAESAKEKNCYEMDKQETPVEDTEPEEAEAETSVEEADSEETEAEASTEKTESEETEPQEAEPETPVEEVEPEEALEEKAEPEEVVTEVSDEDVQTVQQAQQPESDMSMPCMSVEDVLAKVNGIEENTDISKGLELSIGENGGSYISLNLMDEQRAMICDELASEAVPVLVVGNMICATYSNQMIKKNLLSGEYSAKKLERNFVDSINQSILASAEENSIKCQENTRLLDIVNCMLSISSDADNMIALNEYLETAKSRLRITQDEMGEWGVRDFNGTKHSMEEVLWVLSLS